MNIIFILASLLTLVSIIYNKITIKSYKKDLEKEKMISFFSQTRMNLIKMVNMNEIDVDSNFFKYVFSATSYSVRALYYYDNKARALDNINIIKEAYTFYIDPNMKNECKLLNNEQKEMLSDVNNNVLKIYLDAHYIEKFIFKLCFKVFKKYAQSIYEKILKNKISKNLPRKIKSYIENIKSNIRYTKSLDDTSACLAY